VDNASTQTGPQPDSEPMELNDSQRMLILTFLATCLTNAETALEAETPDDRSLLSHPFIKGRMNYWRHVASGIKWCGYLAASRKIPLGLVTDTALNKKVEQWMKPLPD